MVHTLFWVSKTDPIESTIICQLPKFQIGIVQTLTSEFGPHYLMQLRLMNSSIIQQIRRLTNSGPLGDWNVNYMFTYADQFLIFE